MKQVNIDFEQGRAYLSDLFYLEVKEGFLLDAIKAIWGRRKREDAYSLKNALMRFLSGEGRLVFPSLLLKEIQNDIRLIKSAYQCAYRSHPNAPYSLRDYIYFALSAFKRVPKSYVPFLVAESQEGNGWASFYLSISLETGLDCAAYARLAIAQGVFDGYQSLAILHARSGDEASMLKTLKEGADLGDEACAFHYAMTLRKKGGDEKEIRHYLEKGKGCGVGEALYRYALTFLDSRNGAAKEDEGEKWLIKAAHSGSVLAPLFLGKAYLKGRFHKKPDYELAERYLLLAYHGGSSQAGHLLINLYRGEIPEAASSFFHPRRAYSILTTMCKNHRPEALFEMGEMHFYGIGIKCDVLKAIAYYARGAMLGSEDSRRRLKEILLGGYCVGLKKDDVRTIFLANAMFSDSPIGALADLADIYEEGILSGEPDFLEGKRLRQIAAIKEKNARFFAISRLLRGKQSDCEAESC